MNRYRVAYYAHHFGSGHLRNAANLAGQPHIELMVMSSRPNPGGFSSKFVPLSTNRVHGYEKPQGGPFQHLPIGLDLTNRAYEITKALRDFEPDVVVVDVSAEVTALSKISGCPTLAVRLHGDRNDRAHLNMFDAADGILAYYDQSIEQADLLPHLAEKTTYAGMLAPPYGDASVEARGGITVLTSLGSDGVNLTSLSRAAAQTPDIRWTVVGKTHGFLSVSNVEVAGIVDNPEAYLHAADLVVSSSGHNAVRDTVAARKPMILFPEDRMYNEQQRFAESIGARFGIPVINKWSDFDWSTALAQTTQQNPELVANQMLVGHQQFASAFESAILKVMKPRTATELLLTGTESAAP